MDMTRVQLQKALIILILILPVQVFAQNKTVSIQAENITLQEVLTEIRTQTGFDYILNDEIISPNIKVNINVNNVSIDATLNKLFKNLDATYKIKSETIIVTPKNTNGRLNSESNSNSNNVIVSGHIFDSKTKKPIPFATITIKNDAFGVISNEDGSFTLPVSKKDTSIYIKIRCIGYNQLISKIFDLENPSVQQYYLIPKSYQIKEAVIKAKKLKKKSATEIVYLAVNNIESNYPNQPFMLKGYYRDYLKIDEHYENLFEAAVEVEDLGFNTDDRVKTKTGLIYGTMNRTFPVDSTKIINYGKSKGIPYGVVDFSGTNEFKFLLFHNPIRNYKYESFDFIKYIQSDFINNHTFALEGIEYIDSMPCYHIVFKYFNAKKHEYNTQYATGSVWSIIGGKPLYTNYRANGEMYIQTNNYKIHNLSYKVYYDNIKLWDLNLEYRDRKGVLYLNYISFNNIVEFSDLKSIESFYLKNIWIDKKRESIKLFFNNDVDSLSALNKRNYKLKFDGNRLKVTKVTVTDTCVVLKIKHFNTMLGSFEQQYANRLKVKLKRIKDYLGNEVNSIKTARAYQYREFFVNDASSDFQSIPKERCLDPLKSMIYFNDSDETKPDTIIFNSPLLH